MIRLPFLTLAVQLFFAASAQALTIDEVVALPQRPGPEDTAADSVVSLGIEIAGATGTNFKGGLCSGALVGRRSVLTAAHCTSSMVKLAQVVLQDPTVRPETLNFPAMAAKGLRFFVSFGRGFPARVEPGQSFEIVATHFNLDAFRAEAANPSPSHGIRTDIAVFELRDAVPATHPALPLGSREPTHLWPRQSLRIYGYNWSGTKGDLRYLLTSGLLPAALGVAPAEEATFLRAVAGQLAEGIAHFLADGRSPCPGTSGGPIVADVNGRPTVVGVITEQGSKTCELPAAPQGNLPATSELLGTKRQPSVSYHYDWLNRTIEEIEK